MSHDRRLRCWLVGSSCHKGDNEPLVLGWFGQLPHGFQKGENEPRQ